MTNSFLKNIAEIKKAINTNNLVIFVGAGVSMNSGLPSWKALINAFIPEIEIPKDEKDDLKIAQMYFDARKPKEYIDKVREVLKHKKIKYNPLHDAILDLKPAHIVTTNYDDLLEQAIRSRALPYSIIAQDTDFPHAFNTNLLVKMHGDLDIGNIVLKENDYLNYSINHPLIDAFIKSVFASKTVLFIGYSYNDPNLKAIVQIVRHILGTHYQYAYLLDAEEKYHPTQRLYFENNGIRVINFDDSKNFTTDYEKGINYNRKIYDWANKQLKHPISKKLYHLIQFIQHYDTFYDPLSKKHILDQMLDSLERFSELNMISPRKISKLYPFKIENGFNTEFSSLKLATNNPEVTNFFLEQVIIEEGKTSFKDSQNEYDDEKLNRLLEILKISLIYKIYNSETHKEEFENPYINQNVCNCKNCKIKRFEWSSAIEETEIYNITEVSDINEDMKTAFVNYQLCNYRKSYEQFKQITEKAWHLGKYIMYFIANKNMKLLYNFIRFDFNLIDAEKNRILNEIEKINLDEILYSKLSNIDKEAYQILMSLKNEELLNNIKDDIQKYLDQINHYHELYKNKTIQNLTPKYPLSVIYSLYELNYFYYFNFIIYDQFEEFKNVCKKAFEATIVSFSTSEVVQYSRTDYSIRN